MKLRLPAYNWQPRDYQLDAWNAGTAPHINTIVLAWARRHGKDEIAMHLTLRAALKRRGNYYHCLPKYDQARKALWEAVNPHTGRVRWRDVFPPQVIKHVDNQSMKLTLVNGSTWQLIGSDKPDSLMGTTPVGIVFSEAALSLPTAYAMFRPILRENKGWSIHVSSTRGKNHFYKLFKFMSDKDYAYVSHLSALDTDVFDADELAEERAVYESNWGKAIGTSLFEQEFLSSWDSAVVGAVFGQEVRDINGEGRATPLVYDQRYPVHTSWDIGVNDETVVLFWQRVGNQERLIDWYAASDKGIRHFADVIHAKPYTYGKHYAPHDIMVREWGNDATSRIAQAKSLGIKFERPRKVAKDVQIAMASDLLSRIVINAQEIPPEDIYEDCSHVFEAIKGYHFKYDKERKVMSTNPVHDWTSHYADALMLYACHCALDSMPTASAPRRQTPEGFTEYIDGTVIKGNENYDSVRLRALLNSRTNKKRGAWG